MKALVMDDVDDVDGDGDGDDDDIKVLVMDDDNDDDDDDKPFGSGCIPHLLLRASLTSKSVM